MWFRSSCHLKGKGFLEGKGNNKKQKINESCSKHFRGCNSQHVQKARTFDIKQKKCMTLNKDNQIGLSWFDT